MAAIKQFPRIFRFIPDRSVLPHLKLLIVGFTSGLLLAGITLQITLLRQNIQLLQSQQLKRTALENQVQMLERVTKTYPSYRDLYLRLAHLEYRLGNSTQAKVYTKRALWVDPNSKEAQLLDNVLQ